VKVGEARTTRRTGHAGFCSHRWLCAVSLSAVALLGLPVLANAQANRNWDSNGTSLGNGGTGNWNTTDPSWSPNSAGVSGPYGAWNNGAIDNAIFGGTAGTVTLGVPITAHNLTFSVIR
jgi:fibronectin-binding autotransporter adhesin